MTCNACCSSCKSSNALYSGPSTPSPTDICNLIPAGTLQLQLKAAFSIPLCDHRHLEDGWHIFDAEKFASYLEGEQFVEDLLFLISHQFMAVTWAHEDKEHRNLTVRVYLIPWDLPGMKGSLSRAQRRKDVMSRARCSMLAIMPRITQRMSDGKAKFVLETKNGQRTLSEIYDSLESPAPEVATSVAARFMDFDNKSDIDTLDGLGFASTLYEYQRLSIATMIQFESEERRILDPLYKELTDETGKPFYYQPGTTEVLRNVSEVTVRGGVLCEELGTGKTLMILGLVMSNLNQLSKPVTVSGEQPAVWTPLSILFDSQKPTGHVTRTKQQQTQSQFPKFTEILLDKMAREPSSTIFDTRKASGRRRLAYQKYHEEIIENYLYPFNTLKSANAPFYVQGPETPTNTRRSSRSPAKSADRMLFLTAATLIVVPVNLMAQWQREINKHLMEPPSVLSVRHPKDLPNPRKLATEYKIVLMTYRAFTSSIDRSNFNSSPYKACRCPPFPDSRVPNCKCSLNPSPLLQVRWKRLVIDEGHISASTTTDLTPLANLLSVESRWIVTGTPTTNLLGLTFGSRSIAGDEGETDETASSETQRVEGEEEDGKSSRIWTSQDNGDLNKLLSMLANFVGAEFLLDKSLVKSHIKDALLDRDGPRVGGIYVLEQLMSRTMIRHTAEVVELEVVLPPLTHEEVYLDLDPFALKSYNALQAAIAINAVDSQREDEDYLFHQKNQPLLQQLVKNMSQILFWSVDNEYAYNVRSVDRHAHATLQKAREREVTDEDLHLATEALEHIHLASTDPLWYRMQTYPYIPYRTYNIPPSLFESWSRFKHDPSSLLIHPDNLIQLRDWALRYPLKSQEVLVELGVHSSTEDLKHWIPLLVDENGEEILKGKGKGKGKGKRKGGVEVLAREVVPAATLPKDYNETLKEMHKVLAESLDKLNRAQVGEEEDVDALEVASRNAAANANSLSDSRLANPAIMEVKVGNSCSSKLNYILQEVALYSQTEKFLIFSESPLTLSHVAEGLQLAQVKFLHFTTLVPQKVREDLVLTFETSDEYRVFLMELKHGARGLNLVTASRVIFCEPVWKADVESQAIKRAHRIGQNRPVTVKTLAIRNTAEQRIVEYRNAKRDATTEQKSTPIEQKEISDFIANPRFLIDSSQGDINLNFSLLRNVRAPPPCPANPNPSDENNRREPLVIRFKPPSIKSPEKRKADVAFVESPPVVFQSPPKKRRVVVFADA